MTRFWQLICGIIVAIVLLCMATAPQSYDYPPPFVRQSVKFVVAVTLIALIWAIVYRRQLEKLRISILSLFVLVTMEAVMLGVATIIEANYGP